MKPSAMYDSYYWFALDFETVKRLVNCRIGNCFLDTSSQFNSLAIYSGAEDEKMNPEDVVGDRVKKIGGADTAF